jgi:hypothetical protein
LIGDYPITEYRCGARAGERVRLRQDIVIEDHQGKPTGKIYRAGEIWTVLSGSAEPPVDVWLRQTDGKPHTWSDDDDFWRQFERVDENAG